MCKLVTTVNHYQLNDTEERCRVLIAICEGKVYVLFGYFLKLNNNVSKSFSMVLALVRKSMFSGPQMLFRNLFRASKE